MEKNERNGIKLDILLEEEAWKDLSGEIPWTRDLLVRYEDKVDWEAVSSNNKIYWDAYMLDRFRDRIDWTALSNTSQVSLLTPEIVDRFKSYWDWPVLSGNDELPMETIDAMADCIYWKELVNRYDRHNVFGSGFFGRFVEFIPFTALKGSRLWYALVEEKKQEIQEMLGKNMSQ